MKYDEIAIAACHFMKLAEEVDSKTKAKSRGTVIFPAESSKVKDKKDHFPINSESQARNAISRASQYKKVPPWYKGTLQALVDTVVRKVHSKYKKIEISEKSSNPGKG